MIDRLLRFDNNEFVYSDAHLHLLDLYNRDPSFSTDCPSMDWIGAIVSHDTDEFERSEHLRLSLPKTIVGFGIHPQGIRWDTADFLSTAAATGRISFIGEAGFDFFGDHPLRVRDEINLKSQRKAFEFQLSLALTHKLPLVIHSRKATDILMGYTKELTKLPSVIFHSWPGRLAEGRIFLDRGIKAYFSFGTTILRAASHAVESCRELPADCILSETDAPWQNPRGLQWSRLTEIVPVTSTIAEYRNCQLEEIRSLLRENFLKAFNVEQKWK